MSFIRFEHLLERTMGLHAASIGASAIERAVRARLGACNLDDADAYWEQLLRSGEELQALVESVVVPETWFFRDPQAFGAMTRIVMQEWLPAHASDRLRLLSLPCSTGEEPYTMAMALIEAGMPPERFRIDAIDISGRALALAGRGIYGANSFRGKDFAFRDRHFEKVEHGYRVRETVRKSVRFMQGNLLGADFNGSEEAYDILFCRNLLIYFDAETQKRAITRLKRLLSSQGVLFVGHSEAALMLGQELASAKIPMAFAFRKPATMAKPSKAAAPAQPALPKRAAAIARPAAQRSQPLPAFSKARPSAPAAMNIEELHRMADRGQITEAAQGCEAYMREHGATADAFCLLGLISDAGGDLPAAASYYRKALYLKPDHGEALGHLALLLTKQGDAAGAKMLNERLRRLDQRKA